MPSLIGSATVFVLVLGASVASDASEPVDYAVGADVSFLDHAVSQGGRFADRTSEREGLELLKSNGFNWVRLRLFVSPKELPNDLAYTTRLAVRAKRLGFKILLNFHYSDTWADPGKQYTPAAWKDLTLGELCQRVEEHTRRSIEALKQAGAPPDMVQIGNEVVNGMLWPQGRLPDHWQSFAKLVQAGSRGVELAKLARSPPVVIHLDRGGDWPATESFFESCERHGIDFDVIGQSYYPWWHGSLEHLCVNLNRTARRFKKDIVLVEVAYHWRRGVYEPGEGPWPETPEGQRDFLTAIDRVMRGVPNGRGKGVFWWEPAVENGPIYSRGLFDNDGYALPALGALIASRKAQGVETSAPSERP